MNQKILLVEDNPLDVNIFQQMLGHAQADIGLILVAMNLQEALDSLGQSTPDILFLDLHLPDSDGLKTFEVIHSLTRRFRWLFLPEMRMNRKP
jgi:CheY-like chemotaxis protein